jgi:hypothetical protein
LKTRRIIYKPEIKKSYRIIGECIGRFAGIKYEQLLKYAHQTINPIKMPLELFREISGTEDGTE